MSEMAKEDRYAVTLRFLESTDLALPPTAIYVNLKMRGKITFSESTVKRHLRQMADLGLVDTLEDRQYYYITPDGQQWLKEYDTAP